jgi:hypothetical protein
VFKNSVYTSEEIHFTLLSALLRELMKVFFSENLTGKIFWTLEGKIQCFEMPDLMAHGETIHL